MSKQGTTGKRQHVALIPQKLEIIRRLGNGENQREGKAHTTLHHQL
jgi:hypothetical protein